MRKFFVFLSVFLFSFCLLIPENYAVQEGTKKGAGEKNHKKVIAEVNGRKIYTDVFEKLLQGRSEPQALLDQIISYILLAEQTQKKDFRVEPEVEEQLKMMKEQQLAQFIYNNEIEAKAALTDEDVMKLLKGTDKFKVNFQQIVLKTEEEAEELLKKIKDGEDFNGLAKSVSIAKNASKGGQIGYVIPNSGYFDGEISEGDEKKIFNLKDNEVSNPIKTREGYALFKAVSRKDLSDEEMDSRKNYLKFKLQKERTEQARDALLDRLRSKAKINILDKNIKSLEQLEKLNDKDLEIVLARVNAKDIKLKDILPPQKAEYGHQLNTPYLKQPNFLKEMINEKINNSLFIDEAKRLKLDEKDDFKYMYNLFKDGLLGQAYAMDYVKDLKVTDEEMKAYYNENKERFKDIPERIRVRHILVADEAKASDILKRLKEGGDFIELAKEYSICPSAKNGGDLGYFSRGRMAPLFEEAAFKLNTGETSDIVKTNFGYHIIKMEDRKKAGSSDFDDVKYEIEQSLIFQKRDKKIRELISTLRSKAKITINNDILKDYESSVSSQFPGVPPAQGMHPGTTQQ